MDSRELVSIGSSLGDGWESYPTQLGENVPLGCDTENVRTRLEKDKGRLFSPLEEYLELWFAPERNRTWPGHVEKHTIQDVTMLKNLWQKARVTFIIGRHRKARSGILVSSFIFLACFHRLRLTLSSSLVGQRHSWARLQVTHETFRRILAFHKVFPPFCDIIHAYGQRVKEDSETWDSFHRHVRTDCRQYELCYDLRYFERNGRAGEFPWSLRQTGVYQQLDLSTGRSVWILLKPSDSMKKTLEENLESLADNNLPLLHHTVFIAASLRSWRDYLAHLDTELQRLDEISSFANVEQKLEHDYSVDFSACQTLELLRRKLLKALALLDSTANIVRGCKMHHKKLHARTRPSSMVDDRVISALDGYAFQINYYRSRASTLLQRCSGTASLLSNIVEYRNAKSIAHTTQASYETLQAMKTVAHETERENRIGQKNAVTVKALTFIATMYLPASLIASIFSSNLISVAQKSENNNKTSTSDTQTYFILASEFWKFIVVTVALMVITFALTFSLERILLRSMKREGSEGFSKNWV
ncbi:hypothetical protein VTN00DRAFT_3817 [Thermoascus crustaceus]|uniref:uncharacterized protein n=1 Tax=Thermoascus crustaceus TaxID=5088 RepID=UPI003742CDE6